MAPEEKINELIKEAMKNKQRERLEAIRAIKSAILLEKTKEGAGEITDELFMKILQKLVKQREDSATIYRQQNRIDLAEKEEFEASVIKELLPAPLTVEEVRNIVQQIVVEVGAQTMKDMGKVMPKATAALAGKADNKIISDIVKELLSK